MCHMRCTKTSIIFISSYLYVPYECASTSVKDLNVIQYFLRCLNYFNITKQRRKWHVNKTNIEKHSDGSLLFNSFWWLMYIDCHIGQLGSEKICWWRYGGHWIPIPICAQLLLNIWRYYFRSGFNINFTWNFIFLILQHCYSFWRSFITT